MALQFTVYLNGYWFDSLSDAATYGDRPEPYRLHERSLWVLYQLLTTGRHQAVIRDAQGAEVARLADGPAVQQWVQATYPAFVTQLREPVFTRFPHPLDKP